MSIEIALQKFPKDLKLKDGLRCKARALRKEDETAFLAFFRAIPPVELMFIKHRVTDPELIHIWCRHIDLGRNLPLLAIQDGQILAAATLHQHLGGWKRHIGRVSILVLPEFRKRGLARARAQRIDELEAVAPGHDHALQQVGEFDHARPQLALGAKAVDQQQRATELLQGLAHQALGRATRKLARDARPLGIARRPGLRRGRGVDLLGLHRT